MAKRSWLSVLLVLAACKVGLADGNYPGPVLATFHGTLASTGDAGTNGQIGIALEWLNFPNLPRPVPISGYDGGTPPFPYQACAVAPTMRPPVTLPFNIFLSQSVSYQAQFPIQFVIPVTQTPPPDALITGATDAGIVSMALGRVVAYGDANGNGTLDVGNVQAPGEVVVGVSSLDVVYIDGTFPPYPQGFSIVDESMSPAQALPASTPLDLIDPNQRGGPGSYSCTSYEIVSAFNGPVPPGASIDCAPDGGAYGWRLVSGIGADCVLHDDNGFVCDPDGGALPNWPCP
jgi:hypothetical protein